MLTRRLELRSSALVSLAIACTPVVHTPPSPATSGRELAPGVTHSQFTDPRGPWAINLVQVDLKRSNIEIRAVRALDQLKGRERVSEMAGRVSTTGVRVLAAVNADFFNLESGENENNQVIAGEWWKGLKVTDSPYDTYDNTHIQFGIDAAGRPLMDRFILDARAWDRGVMTHLERPLTASHSYKRPSPRNCSFVILSTRAANSSSDKWLHTRRGRFPISWRIASALSSRSRSTGPGAPKPIPTDVGDGP
jgi:hypothetical protein